MDRRSHKRIYLHLKAKMVLEEETYSGYIENVSEKGIGSFIAPSIRIKDDLAVNTEIELHIQIPSGQDIVLACKVAWTKKGLFSGDTIGLGMQIINPPDIYRDWIKEMLAVNDKPLSNRQSLPAGNL